MLRHLRHLRDQSAPRSEFIAGARAGMPIMVGVIPFGLIFGVLAVTNGVVAPLGIGMSVMVFAGSAQFIGVQLIGASASAFVLILTTCIVNLRHMLYSAALAPKVQHLSRRWRWLLAYLLTDEVYVVTVMRYDQLETPSSHQHWYWLGVGLLLWANWQLWTIIGVVFGTQVPASWSLDFTLALTFIGMVAPLCNNRPHLAAAISAGITAVLTHHLPNKLGLLLAAFVGIAVGVWVESRQQKESS